MSADEPKDALAEPSLYFSSPSAIYLSYSIEDDQKIELLRAWERNARQLMVAEGEGMISAGNHAGRPADLLKEIHATLAKMGKLQAAASVRSTDSNHGFGHFFRRLLGGSG